jgi:hypothetical protein
VIKAPWADVWGPAYFKTIFYDHEVVNVIGVGVGLGVGVRRRPRMAEGRAADEAFGRMSKPQSIVKRGDDGAEVREYLENWPGPPIHPAERAPSEPGILIWNSNNDLALSQPRAPSAP